MWVFHGGWSQMAPFASRSGSTACSGWSPKPCRWRGDCPLPPTSLLLLGHTSEEVAAASSAGVQPPAFGSTRQEHKALVAAVRRLAAALMLIWGRGKAVESVVAKQDDVGERGLLQSQSVVLRKHPNSRKLLVKLGLLGPEKRARPVPPLQQLQSLLVKIGLLELQSVAPRQNPNWQSPLMTLGLLGQEHMARSSASKFREEAQAGIHTCQVLR